MLLCLDSFLLLTRLTVNRRLSVLLSVIPSTVPKTNSPTTIPKTNSTTTIPKTNTPTSIPKTTIPIIPKTNIPTTTPKIIIQSTIPKTNSPTIQPTIPESITPTIIPSLIKTSSLITNEPIIPTTIKENIETTILDIGKTSLIFLGFSHLRLLEKLISFFIYFAPIKNVLHSQHMTLTINLNYKNMRSRVLKEVEGYCTLQNKSESKYQYICEVHEDKDNISKIEIEPDFNFINQKNVEVIGMTPLSRMFMNDLLSLDSSYDKLSNSNVYILDNSVYKLYDGGLFNITGIINDPQPKFENKNIVVKINLDSKDKVETEVNCLVNNIREKTYTLQCTSKENIEGYLQSAMSFIDNGDILLINFQEMSDSIIEINKDETSDENNDNNDNKSSETIVNHKKSSGGISGGIIAVIIIIPIILIAAIVSIVIYFKKIKKKKTKNPYEDSTFKPISI